MITLTIVLAEISLALVIVLAAIGFRRLRDRRRDRAAIETLVTRIKSNRPAQVEKLAGVLRHGGQLNDEDALRKADDLIKKQNKFYQHAIDLYYTRNHELLSKLDARLEDLLGQYQTLVTAGEGQAPTVDSAVVEQLSKDIAALSQELEKLREDNAALTAQLKAAEHELDQLGREYVSAFNKPKVAKDKPDQPGEAPDADVRGPDSEDDEMRGEDVVAELGLTDLLAETDHQAPAKEE